MATAKFVIRLVMDDRGINALRRALEAAEELDDLGSWRPEVGEMQQALKLAIECLKPEVTGDEK